MKERPILFSATMVRALLDSSKTQTRRVVKPQPPDTTIGITTWYHPDPRTHFYAWTDNGEGDVELANEGWCKPCPYGQPGDRLWVREAWSTHACFDSRSPSSMPGLRSFHYWADGDRNTGKKRPSIHMPRWASRITLEIVSVRVERLQDISEADCWAEGIHEVRSAGDDHGDLRGSVRQDYKALWESINGDGSWDENPWVWAVEFKRIGSE